MITEALASAIHARVTQLLDDAIDAQYESVADMPDQAQRDRSFAVGAYPALVDFHFGAPGDFHTIKNNALECSGSTFMGLWFLAQGYKVLSDIEDGGSGVLEPSDIAALQDKINLQLTRAALLPKFYQGNGPEPDAWGCPKETMGWYPLVGGFRLPAVLPNCVESMLSGSLGNDISNLADGDIWSWCMAIDNTLPHVFEYHHDITDARVYQELLGSQHTWDMLHPQAQALQQAVRPGDQQRRPIGTFYGAFGPRKQRYSCAVMANILAAIPLLANIPSDLEADIEEARSFVRDACTIACAPNPALSWEDIAYDYYTIPAATIGYIARSHKRILEIARPGYAPIFDTPDARAAAIDYIERTAWLDLQTVEVLNKPIEYANLVYCFSAMMSLRWEDPELFTEDDLCLRTAKALLQANPAANEVPGTGPYQLVGPLWADMASICFVTPPLIEALLLYLEVESRA
ncbi:MAG: hypothetical protein KC503_47690 [Myxococcales bacterium]|nr:hypothetical protein [Myxococcales bacterium]